jgi:molybdate transport system substrate-binding protein
MKITAVIFILILGFNASASELQVFAAASLTDALKDIAAQYQQKTGTQVEFNFAASSVLARQIQEGSPADIFFSADEEKMDWLQKKGLIVNETRKSLLSNSLVIVIPIDSKATIENPQQLAKWNWKIAIAEPKIVPAGIYSKKYLQNIGLWSKLMDRIIPTENVRAALAVVETGDVDAAFVYKTDAKISQRVKIAYEISTKDSPKISYPVAVIKGSENLVTAKKFAEYLSSEESISIFKKYGFIVP